LQILTEGAKKEGTLNLYTSLPVEDIGKITTEFTKKYGVKVSIWRAGSEKILQRIIQEEKAGSHHFDVVDNNGGEMEALHREGVLQAINTPFANDIVAKATPEHKDWLPTYINVFVQAYNTNLIKKEDLPKTWEDFLDPKWKNKLVVEAEDFDWYATLVKMKGEEKGLKLLEEISKTNTVTNRKGHSLLTNLVASGEVPMALTVYSYKAEQLKNDGAPLDWFALESAIARANGDGVSKNAPHPHAAILFFDFMLSEIWRPITIGTPFVLLFYSFVIYYFH
jgi:iron(III) transport system substrate-binding protein